MLTFCSKNFAAGLEEVVGIGVEVGMVEGKRNSGIIYVVKLMAKRHG